MYIDQLDDIVNKYNITYSTIKVNLANIKSNTYIYFSVEKNYKDPLKIYKDHVKISKYKNIFPKCYTTNWSAEVFAIKKVKSTVMWTYVIGDLKGEEIVGMIYEKQLQKTNQTEFTSCQVKLIKRKGDKLHVKWKGYDNSFNCWIDKKDII